MDLRRHRNETGQTFLRGALILSLGLVLVKVIGAAFKIPLTWIIGEEGLGYFNTAYHFYSPIHSLSTAGFPIAISRLVSQAAAQERYGDIRRIRRVSVPIFLFTGLAGTALMLFGAPFYASAIGNPLSLPSMLALAPAIFFGCLMSVYRGWFEGMRNMTPTAVSEILEALCKPLLGLSGALLVLRHAAEEFQTNGTVFGKQALSESAARSMALPYASAAAILGVTAGTAAGFLFLFLRGRFRNGSREETRWLDFPAELSPGKTVRLLVRTALPIGLGALAVNVAGLVDTTILQMRMASLMNQAPAALLAQYPGQIPAETLQNGSVPNFLFGCYSQALTLFMAVPAVTQAFGTSALPNVTAAWVGGDREELQRSVRSVLRVTAVFCVPVSLFLSVMAFPVTELIFGARASGPITARCLVILGIASLFAAMSTPINSMLQAAGRTDLPVKLLLIALSLKAALTYLLTGIVKVNLLGAAAGTLCCYLFLMSAGLWCLRRVMNVRLLIFSVLGEPTFAAVISTAAAYFAWLWSRNFLPPPVSAIISLAVAVIFYLFSLRKLCVIHKSNFFVLSLGEKIRKRLEKFHNIG